jgi:predicted transcriptional regulator
MTFINGNKSSKSPEFPAVIIERILQSCIYGSYIYELGNVIQSINSSSHDTLKKYLFHLIEYELISYDGQKQMYIIADEGLDLLDWITREKMNLDVNSEEIIITIERNTF